MVRDAVPLGECARALVVKLRHHGDVLLAAPVLHVLKAHAPRLEIDALVYDDTTLQEKLRENLKMTTSLAMRSQLDILMPSASKSKERSPP